MKLNEGDAGFLIGVFVATVFLLLLISMPGAREVFCSYGSR